MITGLHRIVVFCKNPSASRRWYERAGFTHAFSEHDMHFFTLGPAQVLLHPREPGEGTHEASRHGALEVYVRVEDVQRHFDEVLARGLRPIDHQRPDEEITEPAERPWGTVEFELEDPDGHRWGFVQG